MESEISRAGMREQGMGKIWNGSQGAGVGVTGRSVGIAGHKLTKWTKAGRSSGMQAAADSQMGKVNDIGCY